MNCATCKVNKIGPTTSPFGGYMCGNEHLQCHQCNSQSDGQCGICHAGTSFVQMNFNVPTESTSNRTALAATTTTTTMTTQSIPPMSVSPQLESSSTARDNTESAIKPKGSFIFPKFYADIDTQSSISQEVLSMHDSQMLDDDENTDVVTKAKDERLYELKEKPPMLNKSFTKIQNASGLLLNHSQMETLYLSKTQEISDLYLPCGKGQLEREPGKLENPSAISTQGKPAGNLTAESDGKLKAEGADKGSVTQQLGPKCSQNTDDANAIHTSDIRFIESTESLQNYFSGGTLPNAKPNFAVDMKQDTKTAAATAGAAAAAATTANPNQTEGLSVNLLRDFEDKNTANPKEIVESYLRSYGPLTVRHFPAYSFNHNCYHSASAEAYLHPPSSLSQTNLRSISVSTESEPALAAYVPKPIGDTAGKYPHPDFFVMHATGMPEPIPGTILETSDKIACPSIDIRMQKVLETFHEDPRQQKVSEKSLMEQSMNYIKIPTPEPLSLDPNMAPIIQDSTCACELPEKVSTTQDLIQHLSQSHRAFYNPPAEGLPTSRAHGITAVNEPPPQFQLISCSKLISNELLLAKTRYINAKPVQACQLSIERSPIKCPESTCQRMIFVSDFNKHLVVDHNKLPMERIAPQQCKNFFIDPRLSHPGLCKCHLLYLIRDKVIDLGSSKFKDFLPLLVMSSRVKLGELVGGSNPEDAALYDDDLDFLMIWLTGIVPDEFPVITSLTVWPRTGQVPKCHLVHSGEVYSIRKSQNAVDVWRSGQMMLLSANEINLLTNDGKEMLELQLVVH